MNLLQPVYPKLALQIGETRVAAVKMRRERQRSWVESFSEVPLDDKVVETSMIKPNIRNQEAVKEAVQEALNAVKPDNRGVSLLIADKVAKITLLPLAELPSKKSETLDLIQWKLKKAIPFKIEDAVITYRSFGAHASGGASPLLVMTAQRSVLKQYEDVLSALRFHAGLVDISSFNLFNLYHDAILGDVGTEADVMVINSEESYFSILFFRGPVPLFFRTKGGAVDDSLEERASTVLAEIQPSLLYYRNRLNGKGIQKTYVRGSKDLFEMLGMGLRDVFPLGLEWINPARVLGNQGVPFIDQDRLQTFSPLIGLAMGRN